MRLEIILSLLVYGFGIYAFGSILLYHFRARRLAAGGYGCPAVTTRLSEVLGVAINVMALLWFVVLMAITVLKLDPDVSANPLKVLLLVMQFLYPGLIAHVVYADATANAESLRRLPWKFSVAALYAAGVAVTVWSLLGIFDAFEVGHQTLNIAIGLSTGALFAATAVFSIATMGRGKPRVETSPQRSVRRWMTAMFGLLLVLVAVIVLANVYDMAPGLLRLIGTSMPLLFCVVAFYHEARFAFFDLFIKRELGLIATVALLTGYLALVLPWLDGLQIEGLRPLVYTLTLLPVAGVLPLIHRKLGRVLDNVWLGRRFSTVEAVKEFLGRLQAATDEGELVAAAEGGLTTIFHAPARVDLTLRDAPSLEFDTVLDVPIRSDGQLEGAIRLGRRESQAPYFDGDRLLLESLADVFASLLDNMRLQHKRREHEQRARELSLQASRSELKALRAQINPHFLFNALNAIAGLIHRDPMRADATVEQLAEVFRYTLKGSDTEWSRLENELEFVRAYLDVEQARFGDRLQVQIESEPAVRRLSIPTMVVQTLVENAVKHGVAAIRGPARIEVRARRVGAHLEVVVRDNGPGFAEAAAHPHRKSSGFGLRNVRQRLAGLFGDAGRLSVERDDEQGWTDVCMALPADDPRVSGERDDNREPGSAGAA